MSSSRVARTIQSRSGDVRLRTNRSSPRSRTLNVAPDQPSVGKRSLGDAGQPVLGQQVRERAVPPARSRRGGADSARRRHVVRAVRPAVEVLHVRVGAVAGQDDDERLGRRGVLLDVDLAGRDVDEVAGRGVERVLEPGRAPRVARLARTGCRSTSRTRRGGGSGSCRRAPSRRSTNTAASAPTCGAEIAIERSMPACWPTLVERSAGVMRVAIGPMIRAATIARHAHRPSRLPRSAALRSRRAVAAPRACPRFSAALGGGLDVWIKREDLLPLAFGGNKLRNLEFLVGAALADGADTLVTSGRRWSNHCRLTAAAGAKAGLERPPRPDRPAGRPARARRAPRRAARARRSTSSRPTTGRSATALVERSSRICGRPVAGRSSSGSAGRGPLGAAGQVLAALEAVRPGSAPPASRRRAVVLPSATGGTQAGPGRRERARRPHRRPRSSASLVARPEAELRPTIGRCSTDLAPLAGAPPCRPGRDRPRRTPARRRLRPPDARRPTRPRASSPGPRASSSTRSTRRRRWPASSPASATGALDGQPSCSGTPAATPGLFEPLD